MGCNEVYRIIGPILSTVWKYVRKPMQCNHASHANDEKNENRRIDESSMLEKRNPGCHIPSSNFRLCSHPPCTYFMPMPKLQSKLSSLLQIRFVVSVIVKRFIAH